MCWLCDDMNIGSKMELGDASVNFNFGETTGTLAMALAFTREEDTSVSDWAPKGLVTDWKLSGSTKPCIQATLFGTPEKKYGETDVMRVKYTPKFCPECGREL